MTPPGDDERDADLVLDLPGGPLAIRLDPADAALAEPLRVRWRELLLDPAGLYSGTDAEMLATGPLLPGPLRAEGGPQDAAADDRAQAAGDAAGVALREATYAVSGQVTRRLLARFVGEALLLHSGAIEHPRLGRMLLIGPSGAGKSTAVSELARGGSYLSDELALLDPRDYTITGYPKPVSRVREGGGKQDIALADLGLEAVRGAGAPDQVVLLSRRRDEPGPARCSRLPLLDAITRIAAQSSSLWRLPDPLGTLARLLDSVGGALDVEYSEAADLEDALAHAPAAVAEQWETLEPLAARRAPAPGEHELTAFVQAIATDDGLVVLRESFTVHLSGLSALAWELLREGGPLTADALERALTAEIGPSPDSAAATRDALERLREIGLVSPA